MIHPKSIPFILICFAIFLAGCKHKKATVEEHSIATDTIVVHNFNSLEPLLHTDSETTHIVNFWAMWCAPCVQELPTFVAYAKNNPNTEVLLVSLDFPKDIETKLKPFLKEKGITPKVVLLDDADANSWIDKIDPNWSGALPFTIIFNNKSRSYHERTFESLKDLENEVKKTINNQ
ncbi:TlpA disulfide reductase family protein [Wenyingzhuangia sp. 2_MG-2023]|uniref:TlpA disulfide reductase family protein n=1 Tax=Wenyingzhuangia sp. 2_MG-2023 TaxID=3062639 RepID=UPI0026E337A8|nr:redoxin domain-containing protein [Wenyingzhuangia sp. 2_MG-2023]MDO6738654.1 thioredoxin domain-containing protein [Wenyingzhuangia sp. 2_MG-2023]MDO6803533.1 thioredoxin domain-containing protein [Wenyingzhuangia sp. 1_MG-2023]